MRNKARLVPQGFCQKEGIDYEETFAPVAHLEAIRILLAFAASKGFKLFQMDIKGAFLSGYIEQEVYVREPLGFEYSMFPNHVYKLQKSFYGLKQAPLAWYARLKSFLLETLKWDRLTKPCFFSSMAMIPCWSKFTLMISFLWLFSCTCFQVCKKYEQRV